MKRWISVIGLLGVALVMLAPSSAAARSGQARPAARSDQARPAARSDQARPAVICPQAATPLGVIPSCCGPISAARGVAPPCCVANSEVGCCPTVVGPTCSCSATPCPAGLSIAVTPEPASEGQQTTISGTLTGTTPVAAQTVDLWEEAAGASAFSNVAQTETNASGAYSFSRTVTTNAKWYVAAGSATSPTVTHSVLAAVVLHASSLRPAVGAMVKLSGTIAPSHAGETVALQERRGGRWVTVARPKLGSASRFTVSRRMRSLAHFRIVLAADALNARSVSAVVAVTPN